MGQKGFFDVERRLEAISALGDPLETIKKIVPDELGAASGEASSSAPAWAGAGIFPPLTTGHRRMGIGRFLAAFFAGWGTGVVSSRGRGRSYRLWRWSGIADRNGRI